MRKKTEKTFSSKVQIILLHFEDRVRNREDVESIRFKLPFTCQSTNKGKFNKTNATNVTNHFYFGNLFYTAIIIVQYYRGSILNIIVHKSFFIFIQVVNSNIESTPIQS